MDDIYGEAANNLSGYSVSLSGNGKKLAISSPNNGAVNGPVSGRVRCYVLE